MMRRVVARGVRVKQVKKLVSASTCICTCSGKGLQSHPLGPNIKYTPKMVQHISKFPFSLTMFFLRLFYMSRGRDYVVKDSV